MFHGETKPVLADSRRVGMRASSSLRTSQRQRHGRYFTGRVAVLPAALHFEKYYYLWEVLDCVVTKLHGAFNVQFLCAQRGAGVLLNMLSKFWRIRGYPTQWLVTAQVLDFESYGELAVFFRETHFLAHPRLQTGPSPTAARATLRADGSVAVAAVGSDRVNAYRFSDQLKPTQLLVKAARAGLASDDAVAPRGVAAICAAAASPRSAPREDHGPTPFRCLFLSIVGGRRTSSAFGRPSDYPRRAPAASPRSATKTHVS